jgi:NAD(P)-dependent dehydrogenase (short-subunit alcohol dehydrogenase family)
VVEKRIKRKGAVITGAGGGIAQATALALANEGVDMVMVDINKESMKKVLKEISAKGARTKSIIADVTDREAVENMVSEANKFLGGVHILVTCAGGYHAYANFEDIAEEDWDQIIALNLKSVYLCCKAVIPFMKTSNWGRIINLGSLAGRSSIAGTSPAHYASAKAAVSMLTQYIAKELGPYGITANTVAPGTTITDRVRNLLTPEKKEMFTKACPLGYLAEPEDIAGVIAFLASDKSRYVTGTTIDVNGGRIMLL